MNKNEKTGWELNKKSIVQLKSGTQVLDPVSTSFRPFAVTYRQASN